MPFWSGIAALCLFMAPVLTARATSPRDVLARSAGSYSGPMNLVSSIQVRGESIGIFRLGKGGRHIASLVLASAVPLGDDTVALQDELVFRRKRMRYTQVSAGEPVTGWGTYRVGKHGSIRFSVAAFSSGVPYVIRGKIHATKRRLSVDMVVFAGGDVLEYAYALRRVAR